MTLEKITHDMMNAMSEFPVEALPTPALNIKRCMIQMAHAAAHADEQGMNASERRKFAQVAYKLHMPPLSDLNSIRAHIACIANGIATGIFNGRDGSQMLYAAQVAISLQRKADEKGRAQARGQATLVRRKQRAA